MSPRPTPNDPSLPREARPTLPGALCCDAVDDITLFDPDTVIDAATFEHPIATSPGISCVIVNGAVAYRDGQAGPGRAGRFLRLKAG